MHLHTYVMLRCCTFSCTCTHTSCYAAVRSHALAHIRHATLLYVLMHLHTYVMLGCCTFSCTCIHTSCYAAVRSLMHLHTYVMLRCCTFSCTCAHTSCYAAVRSHALAYIRHATLLYVLMHLHTYVMLRCCTQSLQKSLIKVATLIKWSGGLPKIMVLEALIKWSGILARSLN